MCINRKILCLGRFFLILCILLASMFGLQIEACADGIVYEKIESNDSFYLSHQKECKEDRRGYTVSKEIACYKSPEGKSSNDHYQKVRILPCPILIRQSLRIGDCFIGLLMQKGIIRT